MKIFVQVVDTKTGIYQTGMIDEPAQKGFEIANAIGHFGVNINIVEWNNDFTYGDIPSKPRFMSGIISETTKIINVVCI